MTAPNDSVDREAQPTLPPRAGEAARHVQVRELEHSSLGGQNQSSGSFSTGQGKIPRL